MNLHRAVIECMYPSPRLILVKSGTYEDCKSSLIDWIKTNRPDRFKEGEHAYVMRTSIELGHTVFGIDLV
jgi:hypothetical protein